MSVLEIYINWVNSVLGEAGSYVDGVEAVQDGKVLCELIDVLAPDAGLVNKVKATGECTPMAYITAALEHMKSHGIKIKFPAQDILHNEIKSMLDVLWLLILNYGIHYIGQNAAQRSVGAGKKKLLEWCQEELGAAFDTRNTLSFNLCNGSWFVKLLEKMAGCSMKKAEDKAEYIDSLLTEIQDRYLIKKDIIKGHDIVDGTADEHTLMIYLSLLKRRMSYSDRPSRREMFSTDGKAAAMAKIHFFERRARSLSNESTSPRSKSPVSRGRSLSGGRSSSANSDANGIRTRSKGLYEQTIADGNETSDWSSTGSLISGKEKISTQRNASPHKNGDSGGILHQTISERVVEQFPIHSESDKDDKEAESQRVSEKETDTLSDFSSGSLAVRDKAPVQIIVQSHNDRVSSAVQISRDDRSDNNSDNRHENDGGVKRQNRNGTETLNQSKLNMNGTKSTGERQIVAQTNLKPTFSGMNSRERNERDAHNHGSHDAAVSTINRRHTVGTVTVNHRDHRNTSSTTLELNGPRIPGEIVSERQTSSENRLGRPSGEDTRIKIKRPKDYILQWEDTMDRLSGVSVPDDPSPRHPLISNFRMDLPSRSKSTEVKPISRHSEDYNSIRSRSSDFTNRSNPRFQSSLPPVISSNANRQSSSNIRDTVSTDQSLDSVLNQLPEDLRQKAADASKFLMHTSGPEVLALIDAIKQAREGVQLTMPNEAARPLRPTSSPGGSRVRFQTSKSPVQRESASFSSASMVSPRVNSSSPYRRNLSSADEMERGENAMLSVSPRSRSRSFSPHHTSNERPLSDSETCIRSSENNDNTEGTQANRSLREEMLIKSLGLNSRVVEDERPSSRIMALSSSPRRISPGGVHMPSPRKPLTSEKYPEVTRLDLGLDSDRSYASQVEDNATDEVTPRQGGSGRVPRREAWEIQKRRRIQNLYSASHEDPAAQSKFIDVLCKEIDALKVKVEMMEDEGVGRSRSQPHRSPSAFNNRITDSSYLSRDLHEADNELILGTQQSVPCKFDRNNSCPLLEVSSRTNHLSKSCSFSDDSTAVKQPVASRSGSRRAYSSTSATRSPALSRSPRGQRGGGISLGYRGPSRSITPEIWGNDLNSPDGLDPARQEKWKRLISLRELSEGEVIEIKQALACAIVEHDILQAKLNNAKHEIHDKLRHTNEVLDDCRHHLAKSQAENMELRSKTEQERQRADALEARIKEMETTVHEVHKDNKQLEKELDKTAVMLDKSLVETKPGIEVLREEKARLVSRLATAEMENEKMKNEVEKLKRNQVKTMQTMDELRECLCKVRRERQELFEQLETLHRRDQTARVKQIIHNYQERGMIHNKEQDEFPRRQSSQRNYDTLDSDEGIFSGSQNSFELPPRSSFQAVKNNPISSRVDTNSRLQDTSFSSSPGNTPRGSASQQMYFDEEFSPSDREIYPHRKTYQPRSRSCSPHSSFHASSLPNDAYFSSSNLDNSFIDQTLQDIEKDMQRERENLLFRVNDQHKLRYIPYLVDDIHNSNSHSSVSRVKDASNRGFSSDRSPYVSSDRKCTDYPKYNSARNASVESAKTPYHSHDNLPSKRSTSLGSVGASPRQSILKSGNRHVSRSRSPSLNRSSLRDENRSGYITPERSGSPVYFPRSSHSPPTRLSPENKEKKRPRHEKSKPGEIARNLQKEFDKENKMIASLSNSNIFKNKSWIEVQSDSDEDTGINSSISSYTGSERSGIGRKCSKKISNQSDSVSSKKD